VSNAKKFDTIFAITDAVMGFVPNSMLIMARDPELLVAFAELSAITVARPGRLNPGLKALLMYMVSRSAGCQYCAAHSSNLAALRAVPTRKIEALWQFEQSHETNDDGTLGPDYGHGSRQRSRQLLDRGHKEQSLCLCDNTGTGTISSYLIAADGSLSLLNATAAVTGPGTAPIDFALSDDSHFLFVRLGTKETVAAFRVESNGSLTPLGTVEGVPAGAQGLAAR
jgi:alkylhydroperoxidase family enzyme